MSKNRSLPVRILTLAWVMTSLVLMAFVPFAPRAAAQAQAGSRPVVVIRWDGPLSPVWDQHLERALRLAEERNAEALLIELNTPGGSINLMNNLVRMMRNSPLPIIVYVSPSGSMAGSAGTMLTLAGHVAAMAPETTIGAASPVGAQGEDIGETMMAKEKEMLRATVRSLAEWRGEEAVELAEATIESARAVSVSEALAAGLVDVRARDIPDLLAQLDGREIRFQEGTRTLHIANASQIEVPPTWIEEVLLVLASPNLVFLLLAIGVQAILIELSSPGGWVAGFIGVVCITLAIYGMGALPVNWFGIIFLVIAFVLFLLEIKTPTYGGLTVAGVISFIAGALVLFNSPNVPSFQRVSIPLVVGTGIVLGSLFLVVVTFALRAQAAPVRIGSDALVIGQFGTAREDFDPEGPVQIGSELWTARAAPGTGKIHKGERVRVQAVEGLMLIVRKESEEGA